MMMAVWVDQQQLTSDARSERLNVCAHLRNADVVISAVGLEMA